MQPFMACVHVSSVVYDVNDVGLQIGVLNVSVECVAALRAVQQEMQSNTLQMPSAAPDSD